MYKQKIKDVIDFCSWISTFCNNQTTMNVVHSHPCCRVLPSGKSTLNKCHFGLQGSNFPQQRTNGQRVTFSNSITFTLSVSCGVDSLLLSKFPLYYNYKPTRQKPATCAGAEQWLLVASLDWSRGITCNTWVNLCHALLQRALATSIYCLFFPALCHVTNL